MDDTLIGITGGCFIIIGVSTAAFFCYRIFQGLTSNRWPIAIGVLESADLKQVIYGGREVDGSADQASARVVNFSYSYSVADRKYDGSRVTYSDGINKTSHALKRLQKKYRGKSQVQVFYNPRNPGQSVLVPGLSIFNFTPLITSVLFTGAGLFILTHDFS